MIDSTKLTVFLLAIQVVAFTPGPVWFHLISKLSDKIDSKIYFLIIGNTLGIASHIFLSYLGLSLIISQSAVLYNVIKLLGGVYLIYLAIKILLRKDFTFSNIKKDKNHNESWYKSLSQAYFINILNPKVITFIISFFPQFIDLTLENSSVQYLIFGSIYIVNASIFLLFLAKVFIYLKNKKTGVVAKVVNYVKYISGLVLIYFGVKSISSVGGNS